MATKGRLKEIYTFKIGEDRCFIPPALRSKRDGNIFSLSVHGGGGGAPQPLVPGPFREVLLVLSLVLSKVLFEVLLWGAGGTPARTRQGYSPTGEQVIQRRGCYASCGHAG